MPQFKALDPKVEVNGQTVLSIVDGMGTFKTLSLEYLSQNGIPDPQLEAWYSQQDWLNAFHDIAKSLGGDVLRLIGNKIPENAQWPPEIQTIKQGLASIDVAYHINHRIGGKLLFDPATGQMSEGIGHYMFHDKGDSLVWVTCDNPYPCDFDFGIVEAVANKFCEPGIFVRVRHGGDSCRKDGHDHCTYTVSWSKSTG
ncbi:hypothetical protein ACFL27_27180 [candidate division CSSED10-310 bacterium]|uniref:4-vinyl reductase 4VR domain-containing protein n=1 Tax=candidate division CSSED10-310 bacterium TaxID=2855610 RepID=A0ABV6Z608_UNCC1